MRDGLREQTVAPSGTLNIACPEQFVRADSGVAAVFVRVEPSPIAVRFPRAGRVAPLDLPACLNLRGLPKPRTIRPKPTAAAKLGLGVQSRFRERVAGPAIRAR